MSQSILGVLQHIDSPINITTDTADNGVYYSTIDAAV